MELVLKNPTQDAKLEELKESFNKRYEKLTELAKQIAAPNNYPTYKQAKTLVQNRTQYHYCNLEN